MYKFIFEIQLGIWGFANETASRFIYIEEKKRSFCSVPLQVISISPKTIKWYVEKSTKIICEKLKGKFSIKNDKLRISIATYLEISFKYSC